MRPVPDFTVSLVNYHPDNPAANVVIATTRTAADGTYAFVDADPPISDTSRFAYSVCPGGSRLGVFWQPTAPWIGFCPAASAPGPRYIADLYLNRQITNPTPSRVIATECPRGQCPTLNVTSPVTMTWDPVVADGVYYDVVISAFPSFQLVALVTVRTNTLSYALAPGEYWWSVQARSPFAGAAPATTWCHYKTTGIDGCIGATGGTWNTQFRVQ
jgi:hypothetical protein